MLTRNFSKIKIPKKDFNPFVNISSKVDLKLLKNSTNISRINLMSTNANQPLSAGAGGCLTPLQQQILGSVGAEVGESSTCVRQYSSYKSCLILGHGSIKEGAYTVIPENLNITFYVEKGSSLNTNVGNRQLLSYNMNNSMPNPTHHYLPNTMIMDMNISFLSFFQYRPDINAYSNFTDLSLINSFGLSGIVTKKKYEFKSFMDLEDEEYISRGIQKKHITKRYLNQNKIITIKYKVLYFGKDIYGYTHSQDPLLITIINTMINEEEKLKILEKFKLKKSIPSRIPDDIFRKILSLSFIHHNYEIIDHQSFGASQYVFNLGKLLKKIEDYNSTQHNVSKRISLCHGIVCRSFPTISVNPLNTRATVFNRRPNLSMTEQQQLIRLNSYTNNYKKKFGDIWNRINQVIHNLKSNNNNNNYYSITKSDIKEIKDKYSRIFVRYNEIRELNDNQYHFIMYLLDNNIIKARLMLHLL